MKCLERIRKVIYEGSYFVKRGWSTDGNNFSRNINVDRENDIENANGRNRRDHLRGRMPVISQALIRLYIKGRIVQKRVARRPATVEATSR